jgi:hypothetical protein
LYFNTICRSFQVFSEEFKKTLFSAVLPFLLLMLFPSEALFSVAVSSLLLGFIPRTL